MCKKITNLCNLNTRKLKMNWHRASPNINMSSAGLFTFQIFFGHYITLLPLIGYSQLHNFNKYHLIFYSL